MKNLLFIFLMAGSLFAAIHETAHFEQLAGYVDQNTLVLLDIDDTIIAPKQMLGSDTWFEYRLKKHQADFGDGALEKTLAEWEALRHLSQMQVIENEIPAVITHLQEKRVPVMALTVQGLALATRTVLQLREHQIDLSKTAPRNEDRCVSVQGHTILYRKGIVFTSGKGKGISFFELCNQIEMQPTKIVMVDDKLSHLQAVEKEAEKRGIEFIGLRYSYSDERKKAFSPEVAEYQLKHSTITHLISDEEAKERMKRSDPLSLESF